MTSIRRTTAVALGAAAALAASAALAPSASATTTGTTSLAEVLLADTSGFDTKSKDFDILTKAVLTVLEAKPDSPVKVLTDGSTPVTAFIPNDQAFRALVTSLTGDTVWGERKVFQAVASLGVDTVETVLLYHVVPGATIDSTAALASDGASLTTAQGGTVGVSVSGSTIRLLDKDTNAANARVIVPDVNAGNKQIAHGVNQVLRPLDLPPIEDRF